MRKLLCKENLIYVGIVISVILVYLIRIIKSPISIDTEAYIASPSTIINSWDSISRISLGILKNLFNNININLALTNIISFIILLISQFILCNHILKKLNKKV